MKRWSVLLLALICLAFLAPPAFAQGPNSGDHVCFGDSTLVGGDETPNNVVLFGCGARIQKGAQVRQDVVSFGGDVVVESGATIDRDVVVFGGRLTLESGSVVHHDVSVVGGILDRQQGSTVDGRVNYGPGQYTFGPRVVSIPPFGTGRGFLDFWGGLVIGAIRALVATVALIALGALVLVFMPAQTQQVAATAERAALPSFGVGCLTFLVAPSLVILFVITCLGIPLGVILAIAMVAAVMFGWIAIGTIVGDRLLRAVRAANIVPMVAMLVGLLILWVITQLPILGGLIGLFVATLALGAVVLTRFGTRPYPGPVSTALTPLSPPPPPVAPAPPAPPAPVTPPATGGTETSS